MPGEPVAILDACVLVQAPLRDTLLRLAEPPSLYQPRWSDEIIAEMKRALETQIGLTHAKTAYLERELRRHFADCWVTGFQPLVRKMTNDPKDRHVLAAAVGANAHTVVTFNKRHSPPPQRCLGALKPSARAHSWRSFTPLRPSTPCSPHGARPLSTHNRATVTCGDPVASGPKRCLPLIVELHQSNDSTKRQQIPRSTS